MFFETPSNKVIDWLENEEYIEVECGDQWQFLMRPSPSHLLAEERGKVHEEKKSVAQTPNIIMLLFDSVSHPNSANLYPKTNAYIQQLNEVPPPQSSPLRFHACCLSSHLHVDK